MVLQTSKEILRAKMNEDVTFEDWSDFLINEEKWDLPKEIVRSPYKNT